MGTSRGVIASLILLLISGCAVVKTTDVTDAAYKRHQSVALLGWPLYTRVTDQDRGTVATVATSSDYTERDRVRAAELLGSSVEIEDSDSFNP
jgi:hypothetical protein